MIYWALLLHFYQPPTQFPPIIKKVARESYRPLLNIYKKYPEAKVTVNINGSLTEILEDLSLDDILAGLGELSDRGQVEFTGSAKYHPILPLIPIDEVRRQIDLNYKTNRKVIGEAYRPEGFFPPEMCYSKEIVNPIIETGHRWLIMSGIGCPVEWPVDIIHQVEASNGTIPIIFRDDIVSNTVSFGNTKGGRAFVETLKNIAEQRMKEDIYVVTAMDAETFGHHIRGWESMFLESTILEIKQQKMLHEEQMQILEKFKDQVKQVTISELLEIFPKGGSIEPFHSSWSTTGDDLKSNIPYPLWKHPSNYIHYLQWELIIIAIEIVRIASQFADNTESKKYAALGRLLLDRALHSDQMWWASKHPWWSSNMVAIGLKELMETILNAYRAIKVSGANESVKKELNSKVLIADDIAMGIIDNLFGSKAPSQHVS